MGYQRFGTNQLSRSRASSLCSITSGAAFFAVSAQVASPRVLQRLQRVTIHVHTLRNVLGAVYLVLTTVTVSPLGMEAYAAAVRKVFTAETGDETRKKEEINRDIDPFLVGPS